MLTSTPCPAQSRSIDSIVGEWLPILANQQRLYFFYSRSISMCGKVDVQIFTYEKFGFFERLIMDKCLGLLDLGDVVYPQLVRLFYANLKAKSTINWVYFVSLAKLLK